MSGTTIVCPQCGGENDLPTGQRFFPCRYCGTSLYADRSGVVSYYRVPSRLDGTEAEAALRRWMAGNDTVRGLDTDSEIQNLEALDFPMWMFRIEEATGESTHTQPAAPLPIPMVLDLELPAGEIEPYREKSAAAEPIEITIPIETAQAWLRQKVGDTVVLESALVRISLWKCHYRYEGSDYVALVDASTGLVMASVYPEKSESPYYLVAGLSLVLFTLEGLIIGNPFLKVFAFTVTALPLVGLAYWVARRV